MNNGTNQEAFSLAMLTIDVAASAGMYIAKHSTSEQLAYWRGHKKELQAVLRKAFLIPDDPFADTRLDWEAFYKKRYGWDVDFSQVFIPSRPSLAHRLIIIAKGLTANMVYGACSFKKWNYIEGSLDATVPNNIRTSTNGHYAIWVLDGVEPDAEFLGKSTEVADPEMKIGMTLTERLLLEDKCFDETGKHLDIKGGTLCGGSRFADGNVPYVHLDGVGEVSLHWINLSYVDACFGVRRAIST